MSMVEWLREQLDTDERIAQAVSEWSGTEREWTASEYVGDEHNYAIVEPGVAQLGASYFGGEERAAHIAEHDPARVLRQVKAVRRMLDRHTCTAFRSLSGEVLYYFCERCQLDPEFGAMREWPCDDVRDLASIYSHRPGYLPEWAPEEVTA